MLIIITGSDRSLCDKLKDFLEARSFYGITDSNDIIPGRHHIYSGTDEAIIADLMAHGPDVRVVFAGSQDRLSESLEALAERSDAHFTTDSSDSDIVAFVTQAMSSVPRPSWDQYFIDIAKVVAGRGNCMKRQVAAVLVKDNRVVATGYNGTPRGATNCNEGGCERCNSLAPSGTNLDDCVCNHAEENAICQAAYHGISIRDATLYCTHSPCLRCAKLLINAGISEVVYNADYPLSARSIDLLEQCNVVIRRYP